MFRNKAFLNHVETDPLHLSIATDLWSNANTQTFFEATYD